MREPKIPQWEKDIDEAYKLSLKRLVEEKKVSCTCFECEPEKYSNPPRLCRNWHFKVWDLILNPHERPSLLSHSGKPGSFEALHLVRTAISSFERPEEGMHPDQRDALQQYRRLVSDEHLLEKFARDDCSIELSYTDMYNLAMLLNEIFFLGAIYPITFYWDKVDLDDDGNEADCVYKVSPDQVVTIRMHPKKGASGESPARHRIGVLLHELVHAFLEEFTCHSCVESSVNCSSHGRAWQLLAKAIEENAPRLLWTHVDLQRIYALYVDMRGGVDGASGWDATLELSAELPGSPIDQHHSVRAFTRGLGGRLVDSLRERLPRVGKSQVRHQPGDPTAVPSIHDMKTFGFW